MARMHAANNPAVNENARVKKGAEYSRIRCPRCGDPFGNLPTHLPTCDGGEA